MTDSKALVIQSGRQKQIPDADNIVTGAGIKNVSGVLTITPAGTGVVIGGGKDFAGTAGSNFDFSSSTGTFSTTTGSVTVGGAATFTAAGTALSVTNNATFGGTATHTGATFANGGLDRSTAATLLIGTTNASAITIGKVGSTTTVAGDLAVSGNETITGTSTFTSNATFNGNVTFGDAATDTVAFVSRVGPTGNTDLNFVKELNHTIAVDASTTAATAGGNLTLVSGNGNGAAGGTLALDAGSGTSGGALTVGGTNAASIGIGHSGIATTITGGLTQITGAFSLTGNGASSLSTSAGAISIAPAAALTLTGGAASTWSTSAGALTITSAAAATWSTGAGALSLSGFSALNLQVAGATSLVVGSSALTVQAGVTLATTGSGNINLPNNGSARFQIEGTAVGATVTAPNLDTLTNGSNADALHIHAASSGAQVTGQTTTGVTNGQFGYVSGVNTWSKAQADGTFAQALVMAVNIGTVGAMGLPGSVVLAAQAVASPAVLAGDQLFLALSTQDAGAGAGRVTNLAPTASGQYVTPMGVAVADAASGTVKMIFLPGVPVLL